MGSWIRHWNTETYSYLPIYSHIQLKNWNERTGQSPGYDAVTSQSWSWIMRFLKFLNMRFKILRKLTLLLDPAGIYLFKVNNGKTRTMCEIQVSKFRHFTGTEWRFWTKQLQETYFKNRFRKKKFPLKLKMGPLNGSINRFCCYKP